jgi:hypothetical protein
MNQLRDSVAAAIREKPEGIPAITIAGLVGGLYTAATGIHDLVTAGSPTGVGFLLAGLLVVAALYGLWRDRLWGYVTTVGVAAVSPGIFLVWGEPVAAIAGLLAVGYLGTFADRYLGDTPPEGTETAPDRA